MQNFRSMAVVGGGGGGGSGGGGGVGSRFFGGERRLRPFPNQALKCPRCDSLNTKFCYYNNYNLSQPRHFCKSCRRYWTKGGVLRNVPVGGGCRKAKKSKRKPPSSDIDKEKESASHSSSDSSGLTATEAVAPSSSSAVAAVTSAATFVNFPETTLLSSPHPNNSNPRYSLEALMIQQGRLSNNLDHQNTDHDKGIFIETGGSFTGLMTAGSNNPQPYLGFHLPEISPFRLHHEQEAEDRHQIHHQLQHQQQQKMTTNMITVEEELKFQELTKGFYNDHQTMMTTSSVAPVVGSHGSDVNSGLTALDWQSNHQHHQATKAAAGLFDLLPNTVVVDNHHQSYWTSTQTSHWLNSDHQDHSLNYLP